MIALFKSFLVDLIVTAGVKIWEIIRRGAKHHESYSNGKTEDRLKNKIKDKWGD
jgi:hypothetical protein